MVVPIWELTAKEQRCEDCFQGWTTPRGNRVRDVVDLPPVPLDFGPSFGRSTEGGDDINRLDARLVASVPERAPIEGSVDR